jgi:hypothetical protein
VCEPCPNNGVVDGREAPDTEVAAAAKVMVTFNLYWSGVRTSLAQEGRKEGDGLEVMGAPGAGLEVMETSGGYGDLDLQHL